MRVRLRLAFCLMLVCAGCRTAWICRPGTPAGSGTELSEADRRLSKALANYGKAILCENELGWADPATSERWDAAAECDPGRPRLYLKAAALHFHHGEPAKATQILEQARDHNPRHAETRLNLALGYEAIGELDLAARECRAAMRLDSTLYTSYVRIAAIRFKQNADRQALRFLRRGLARVTDKAKVIDACINCGTQFAAAGQLDRAIPCFEVVLERDPSKRPEFYVFFADLYEKAGDTRRAVAYLEEAAAARPTVAAPFLRLADHYSTSDPARAESILRQARALLPGDPSVHFAIAFTLMAGERFKEAIEEYRLTERLVEESEGDVTLTPQFYLYYGMACEQAGRLEEASGVFERGIALYPDSHVMLNYLAYMWAEKGLHLEKGLEYVTRALELDPKNGAYVDTLGWIHYKKKDFRKALEEITRANELIKDDPIVIEHIGDAHHALGNLNEAVSHWKKSFIMDPENEAVTEKLKSCNVDIEQLRKQAAEEQKQRAEKQEQSQSEN